MASPNPIGTNAQGCTGDSTGLAVANFLPGSNMTTRGCDFTIPAAGGVQCSIRGLDGLPVELLDFAIDDDVSGAAEENKPDTEASQTD